MLAAITIRSVLCLPPPVLYTVLQTPVATCTHGTTIMFSMSNTQDVLLPRDCPCRYPHNLELSTPVSRPLRSLHVSKRTALSSIHTQEPGIPPFSRQSTWLLEGHSLHGMVP